MSVKLLIVEDEQEYREALAATLADDFSVTTADSVAEANRLLGEQFDLVLLDVRLSEGGGEAQEGLELLETIKQDRPHLPVVMMTAFAHLDLAVEALRLGASDFIQKAKVDLREFRKVLENAIKRSQLERRIEEMEADRRRAEPWDIVGDHPSVHAIRELVDLVAKDGYSAVLIRGETGTGKELVARAVHERGWRKDAPFVPVALPSLAPSLLERELFGHVRGAFTDAREGRQGYVQRAVGGVLFLDEIGDLSPEFQPKLLRFLDTKEFTPIGSVSAVRVDVQIVCATNRDLEQLIATGGFRKDLYYRLRTVEILTPPLRDRLDDLPLLVDHFLHQFRQQGRTRLGGASPIVLDRLSRYGFPGNVRELRSVIERAMMLATVHGHPFLELEDLPEEVQHAVPGVRAATAGGEEPAAAIDLDGVLAQAELGHIERALQAAEGRKTEAWRLLGLNDRFALLRRVKRIKEQYPALFDGFPFLRAHYGE